MHKRENSARKNYIMTETKRAAKRGGNARKQQSIEHQNRGKTKEDKGKRHENKEANNNLMLAKPKLENKDSDNN